MIFTKGKKCFVDKDFHITEDENKATAFVNVLPNNMVEILFLTPVAKLLNYYESIEEVNTLSKRGGDKVYLPSYETCFLLNLSSNGTPKIKDCHLDIKEPNSQGNGNCFFKVNSKGLIDNADTLEILSNLYFSIRKPLLEFIELNPTSKFPIGYALSWAKQ